MQTITHVPDPSTPTSTPLPTPMVYVRDEPAWEYRRVVKDLSSEDAPSEEELNALGQDGWELAGLFTASSMLYLFFKRLKG